MNHSLTKTPTASDQENIPPLRVSLSPQSKSFSIDPEIENRQTLSVLQIQDVGFSAEKAAFKEQENLAVCSDHREENVAQFHNEEHIAVVRELLEDLIVYLPINTPTGNAIDVNLESLNTEELNDNSFCPIVKRETKENLEHASESFSSTTDQQLDIKVNEYSEGSLTSEYKTPLEVINGGKCTSAPKQPVDSDALSQHDFSSSANEECPELIAPCLKAVRTSTCDNTLYLHSEVEVVTTSNQVIIPRGDLVVKTESKDLIGPKAVANLCQECHSPDSSEGAPMPTQVSSDQKLEEKEESRSDLSFEASPAHSCKTENMSDSLTNEKDLLDENINPCEDLLSDLADFQNNEKTIENIIKTEPVFTTPKRKSDYEKADLESSELFLPNNHADTPKQEIDTAFQNGDPKRRASGNAETENTVDGAAIPLTPRKPVVGVASVNRRPPKSEKKAANTDDQLPVVQGANQSEAGPEVAEFSDSEFRVVAEAFQDAESFDFLQKAGSSQVLKESTLSRLSLYVKFDPLLRGSTPAKEQRYRNINPDEQKIRSANDTFTLCKNETINEELCSEDVLKDSTKLIDFNSPDQKDTPRSTRTASVEPLQKEQKFFTDSEMKKAMQIQDLLYHERILSKDKEIWDKDKHYKQHVQQLEKNNADFQMAMKTTRNMMELVVKMLKQWQGKKELDRVDTAGQSQKLVKERDQALEDLQNVEAAFADLHRRYEKTKLIVESMKQNESSLRDQLTESIEKLKKQEQMYDMLKNRTEEKLESANSEIETVKRVGESEIAVLGAQLKKAEMKIGSLERSLEQKNQEYAELSNIYDDLIARVGSRN